MGKEQERLILVGGRWHIARLLDYGHAGMGWGDPETTALICFAGDEERTADLPSDEQAEVVGYVTREAVEEVAAGRLGNHLAPKGTYRPENEVPVFAAPPAVAMGGVTEAMVEAFMVELQAQGVALDDFSPPIYPAKLIRAALAGRAALEDTTHAE